MDEIRIAELFAGVGGFRIGFEEANKQRGDSIFRVTWSNQWEPSTKVQHASDAYIRAFGPDGHSNEDIAAVAAHDVPDIDLLVGGFPCQDYSVAATLNRSGGLAGKKGVLWWEIHRILRDKSPRPKLLLLENVDRLLKSPVKQRGRDFAVMLASLADLGYAVEWRVINAAEYGMPQRRRRVFILGYLKDTVPYKQAENSGAGLDWLQSDGIFAQAFPVYTSGRIIAPSLPLTGDLAAITDTFNLAGSESPFHNAGMMLDRTVYTSKVSPNYDGPQATLGDFLEPEERVPEEFFIKDDLETWAYLKGAKSIERISKASGHTYNYTEGGIAYPDPLDRPSRTIITGEGGRAPSRFKHVVETASGRLRRLLPVELERLNMFPDDHTAGVPDSRRAFLMGNALVTGIVQRIAVELAERIGTTQPLHMTQSLDETVPIAAD